MKKISGARSTVRLALAQMNTVVGDLQGNARRIVEAYARARSLGAQVVCFPELTIPGYPPEDLLHKTHFVSENIQQLKKVAMALNGPVAVVGFVDRDKSALFNAAAVISGTAVRAVYHKRLLPNYGVFDEKRYFAAGERCPVFRLGQVVFGVNICEDVWEFESESPVQRQVRAGARLILNINASPYHVGKLKMREAILRRQARFHKVWLAYTNLVGGQDELVFDGQSLVIDPRGRVVARAAAFREDLLLVDVPVAVSRSRRAVSVGCPASVLPPVPDRAPTRPLAQTQEIYQALVLGLRDYVIKNGFHKVVLGLSGGIDSSLVACLAADSLGADNVVGVSMPSIYTSQESRDDAESLARNLGIQWRQISIQEIFELYLKILFSEFEGRAPDITEENLQARIRGNLIMALSNKFGYLALNTGNKSEVSCGYCTLYGDMAGGFGVIKDVPKTLVYQLARDKNQSAGRTVIPERVLTKAPTAELRVGQKDSDSLPEYELLDRVLKMYVEDDKSAPEMARAGIPPDVARRVIGLVEASEYKRRQAAPGIKITPKSFGKDRRMPITNHYRG